MAKNDSSSLSASDSAPYTEARSSACCFFPADCLMAGKNPTLSDPCNTPSVNKHRAHIGKQPTPKCLSFIIQTDFSNKESKQKHKSNVQVIKGAGFCLPPHYSLLICLQSHSDVAQKFPHHHAEVSSLPFLYQKLLSDQEGQLLISYLTSGFPAEHRKL